jgi:integrase
MPGRFKLTRPLSGNSLNKSLESVVFENLEHLTIHDLRRTGATLLTEHGWNADVIEKALAHEKTGIRAVYIVAEHLAERTDVAVVGRSHRSDCERFKCGDRQLQDGMIQKYFPNLLVTIFSGKR